MQKTTGSLFAAAEQPLATETKIVRLWTAIAETRLNQNQDLMLSLIRKLSDLPSIEHIVEVLPAGIRGLLYTCREQAIEEKRQAELFRIAEEEAQQRKSEEDAQAEIKRKEQEEAERLALAENDASSLESSYLPASSQSVSATNTVSRKRKRAGSEAMTREYHATQHVFDKAL